MLGIAKRSAWHVSHRIRHAMSKEPLAGLLTGTVEVDETYVAGRPRPQHGKPKSKRGRGTNKTPVVPLVERGGRARVHKVDRVTAATLWASTRPAGSSGQKPAANVVALDQPCEFGGGFETS